MNQVNPKTFSSNFFISVLLNNVVNDKLVFFESIQPLTIKIQLKNKTYFKRRATLPDRFFRMALVSTRITRQFFHTIIRIGIMVTGGRRFQRVNFFSKIPNNFSIYIIFFRFKILHDNSMKPAFYRFPVSAFIFKF